MQRERSEVEIAWAAGIFEGEGTLSVAERESGKVVVIVAVGMTDFDVVERFARIVGFGNLTIADPPSSRAKGHKPVRVWRTQEAVRVRELIALFMPYFGNRRRAKALKVLDAIREVRSHTERATHCPNGHEYNEENLRLETIERSNGKTYLARRCKICRMEQSRERARRRLGITPDRYRAGRSA